MPSEAFSCVGISVRLPSGTGETEAQEADTDSQMIKSGNLVFIIFQKQGQTVADGQGDGDDARIVRQVLIEIFENFDTGRRIKSRFAHRPSVQQNIVDGDDAALPDEFEATLEILRRGRFVCVYQCQIVASGFTLCNQIIQCQQCRLQVQADFMRHTYSRSKPDAPYR